MGSLGTPARLCMLGGALIVWQLSRKSPLAFLSGIEVGGRTGLTSVFTALCFLPCFFLAPLWPGAAKSWPR